MDDKVSQSTTIKGVDGIHVIKLVKSDTEVAENTAIYQLRTSSGEKFDFKALLKPYSSDI